MKKLISLIPILIFGFNSIVQSQKSLIELVFTAIYNNQSLTLDSIYIENLTQGGDTILYGQDTTLELNYLGFDYLEGIEESKFKISQNYPNPLINGESIINLSMPNREHVKIIVFDLLGRELLHYNNTLDRGNHELVFFSGKERYYLLTAFCGSSFQTIKIVSSGFSMAQNCKLIYQRKSESLADLKATYNADYFNFFPGDHLRFIGYATTIGGDRGSDVIESTVYINKTFQFEINEGIPCPGTPMVTYGSKTYKTVFIGNQCWFKENLDIGVMLIGNQTPFNNDVVEKYCYDDNSDNCLLFGGLYHWDELMQYDIDNGLCPPEWHIPSDIDWCILTQFIDSSVECEQNGFNGTNAGYLMKATNSWDNGGNGNNMFGFNALAGGYRNYGGGFSDLGNSTSFFSSTEYNGYYAWKRSLLNTESMVGRDFNYKDLASSVRCLKDEGEPGFPVVTTNGISNITPNSAICDGNVVSQGNLPVSAYGVCWSININPTLFDAYTIEGSGEGTFSSALTGLSPNITYYVRAYATNAIGTAYGNQLVFTAGNIPCPGIPTVYYEGKTYTTEKIGNQCWLKENLNVGTMIIGGYLQSNNNIIEKYCYDNNPQYCEIYGGLYQWDEAMKYQTATGVQGICPTTDGWHLPTSAEWNELFSFLGGNTIAGGKMKATGTIENNTGLWSTPNLGATNSSGFNALPGGNFSFGKGDFWHMGNYASHWSSSYSNSNYAILGSLLTYTDAIVYSGDSFKTDGISVRCVRNDGSSSFATILTLEVTNITQTTATGGGNVTNDGGSEVISRGICWSSNPNPDLSDSHTIDGSGNGIFTSSITGLSPNLTYYVRAYAINSAGTVYGNQVYFSAMGNPCPDGATVTYDNQTYNTLLIGNQCWLKENLNVGTMITGSNNQTNNGIIEKFCYNNNAQNCITYGGLYQWKEMMQYSNQQGIQAICPPDWRIPTYADWASLREYLGGYLVAGGKMKSTGTLESGYGLWLAPNTGATNISGFTALPGGARIPAGIFGNLNFNAFFWTSAESNANQAYFKSLNSDIESIVAGNSDKNYGMNVRCLKGDPSIATMPSVLTAEISYITPTTAITGGSVPNDGGAYVSIKGVCWNITGNPTTADPHTNDGISLGEFISVLNGLNENTTYFLRAYATNNVGTAYGNQLEFTTQSGGSNGEPCTEIPTVTYEGQVYNTVQIGNQCWLKENLNVGTMVNGSVEQTNNGIIEKYCFSNLSINCDEYGGLYQWDEMMNYNFVLGNQGICPQGWHIPTDSEWCTVTQFVDPTVDCNTINWSGFDVGIKMKSTYGWNSQGNGTNTSGFKAVPGGLNDNGFFIGASVYNHLWSSTEYNASKSFTRTLSANYDNIYRDNIQKTYGLSVRCLKD